MSQRKKIKITHVERRRVILGPLLLRVPCPLCGIEVETVDEADAAAFLSVGKPGLNELIGAGRVHGLVTASGSLRICKQSLLVRSNPLGSVE